MINSTIGLIHLLAAIVALFTGIINLVELKGTKQHKWIGYIYVSAMIILNVMAFMIYHLYGKFGIFHWMAIVSSLTLAAGLYPVIRKGKDFLSTHLSFMYWSVIGLYGAFMAEIFVRLPNMVLDESGKPLAIFYKFTGIAVAITMAIGVYFFIRCRPKWLEKYGEE